MRPDGEHAGIWESFAPAIGSMTGDITFGWSPRHSNIYGNELADAAARHTLGMPRLAGFAENIDFGMRQISIAHEMRAAEWRDYHISFDRTYYPRKPARPKFTVSLLFYI